MAFVVYVFITVKTCSDEWLSLDTVLKRNPYYCVLAASIFGTVSDRFQAAGCKSEHHWRFKKLCTQCICLVGMSFLTKLIINMFYGLLLGPVLNICTVFIVITQIRLIFQNFLAKWLEVIFSEVLFSVSGSSTFNTEDRLEEGQESIFVYISFFQLSWWPPSTK